MNIVKILQAGPNTWEIQLNNETSVASSDSQYPLICFDNGNSNIFFADANHNVPNPPVGYQDALVAGESYCVINCSDQSANCDIVNAGSSIQLITLAPGQSDSFIQSTTTDPPVTWSGQLCCVHHSTRAERIDVRGNIEHVPVEELHSGDVILNAVEQPVRITKVVVWNVPQFNWIGLEKNSLAIDQPREKLLIRPGHPVLLNGNYQILPEAVSGAEQVKEFGYLYTICTDKPDWIRLNGAGVASWGVQEFDTSFKDIHLNVHYQ